MTAQRLSLGQRIARVIVSAPMFAAMAEASRKWTVACPDCGLGRCVWELGGVRYKAAGTIRQRKRCPACRRSGWHRIRWTGAP